MRIRRTRRLDLLELFESRGCSRVFDEDTFLRLRVKLLTLLVGDVHVRYRAEYLDVR